VGLGFILMDDNARPRRALVARQYLERESIERIDWPARSPDILQRRICDRPVQPLTKEELTRALIEEWEQIPRHAIRKLICSFNSRCRAVITARGGHTRY